MALNYPSSKQVINELLANFKNYLPNSAPYKENSALNIFLRAIGVSIALTYDFFKTKIFDNILPFNPQGEFAQYWANLWGLKPYVAQKSNGNVNFTGNRGTNIPIGTKIVDEDNSEYLTTEDKTITYQEMVISTLTQVGGLATATTVGDHNLSTGMTINIIDVNEFEYIGIKAIEVIDSNKFTYPVDSGAPSPATLKTGASNIKLWTDYANVACESVLNGKDKNLVAFTPLNINPSVSGVDSNCFIDANGFAGGRDIETDEELNTRTLQKWGKPNPPFSVGYINNVIQNQYGASRVWTFPITPRTGFFTSYFIYTYNKDKYLPTATDITNVKNLLVLLKPAFLPDANIIVLAPTPVNVSFNFSALTPNTTKMQEAIKNTLEQFFFENVNVGENVTEFQYLNAIQNTVDADGNTIINFTLSAPAGDINISTGEIAKLDTISF